MAQRNPPFRAEHLGSLLRPARLLKTRTALDSKEATQKQLTAVEDDAVKEIVDVQLEVGLHGISDGEYRYVARFNRGPAGSILTYCSRGVFWGTFFQELEGMTEIHNPPLSIYRTYVPDIAGFVEKGGPGQSCICIGKIKHTCKSTPVDQFNYVKSLLPEERWGDIKLTVVSPVWYHLRYKQGEAYPPEVYSSEEAYFDDIVTAYKVELDILYSAGVRNIQIDDPSFAYFCSDKMIEGWEQDKSNTRTLGQLLDLYIATYNKCIAAHKDKMHFGLHICRGNFRGSRHFSEGGYDRIATKLFRDLDVSTFYLEYDTPRAGSFKPLLHLPANKNVILGVITSKFPELEDKAEMVERVHAAADVIAKGQSTSREDALKEGRC